MHSIVSHATMECMDSVIRDILCALESRDHLSAAELDKILRAHNREVHDAHRTYSKKRVLPYYLKVKDEDPETFASWGVTPQLETRLFNTLRMKPRRTASGVATITVITKPWKCSSDCIYCPCDIRMPKSYLHDEPACQRAERLYFDPYLQVSSRLRVLQLMGHATDKIELIVLGGTWTDYPKEYRIWFARELFEALNDDGDTRARKCRIRTQKYECAGVLNDPQELASACAHVQARLDEGAITFNDAFDAVYAGSASWQEIARFQHASIDELKEQHTVNEKAAHRVVGLVFETRPDTLDAKQLVELREIGCTKIQLGIQALDANLLALNGRHTSLPSISRALSLCRLFGFKLHVHFMANLYKATPELDKQGFLTLVSDGGFCPDEVKLYPCALVKGTQLMKLYEGGEWRPYTESELLDVLCADMLNTPPYVRVSRMIRDISANDIVAGNKKTNLRQLVEASLKERAPEVQEIRFREIATAEVALDELSMNDYRYETNCTTEHFLQWVTPANAIVGFLRLSLPHAEAVKSCKDDLPITPDEAMIREVHVYGFAAKLTSEETAAQHHGLGRRLVEEACSIASNAGYRRINVISAIGTRDYYRKLGFGDNGLYQQMTLPTAQAKGD